MAIGFPAIIRKTFDSIHLLGVNKKIFDFEPYLSIFDFRVTKNVFLDFQKSDDSIYFEYALNSLWGFA